MHQTQVFGRIYCAGMTTFCFFTVTVICTAGQPPMGVAAWEWSDEINFLALKKGLTMGQRALYLYCMEAFRVARSAIPLPKKPA